MAPGKRADAAEDRGGEGLDAGQEADVEIDLAVIEQHHHAGDGGECCADDEGERDGAVDIDAEQRCHPPVLLGRPLGAAQRRAGDQQRESDHQDDGEGDDADLQVADLRR